MPIQVKTMRDIWDNKRKNKEIKKCPPLTHNRIFPLEIEKHYLDYLARKRAFLEAKGEIAKAFADYEKHLGEAGFLKI